MGYSSAGEARQAREALGKALEALQQDEDVPEEVLGIIQNVAKSVGALFEAEYASTEPDGKTCVKNALGTLSQTLALLQDVKSEHSGVQRALGRANRHREHRGCHQHPLSADEQAERQARLCVATP
jgi:hypothetical protein